MIEPILNSQLKHKADPSFIFDSEVVWRPTEETIESSTIEAFRKKVGEKDLPHLYARAAAEPNWFWQNVCEDLGILFETPPSSYYQASNDPTQPHWCSGATMNITCSALDKWVKNGHGHKKALVYENEEGEIETLTYADLLTKVEATTAALRSNGVTKGSVVALMMSMNTDVVVTFLAIARCGAIVLPLFSGFGKSAIVSRIHEAEAEFACIAESSIRRQKKIPIASVFQEAARECPTLKKVWVSSDSNFLGEQGSLCGPQDSFGATQGLHGATQGLHGGPNIVDAETPLLLIFTSGTTGKPKGALHTHCGFPIKAAQDMKHPMNLGSNDVVHWITDIGWMMGPWVIFGTLIGGMTLALYDGAPDFPNVKRIWNFVNRHQVTYLGISPTYARMLSKTEDASPSKETVASLKAIGSTGSPWDRDSWMWIFEKVLDRKKPILNYSGGTEISGGILCGNTLSPLKPCSFSGPVLGMAADAFNAEGQPVKEQTGELVILNPWIGMTRGFWKNDPRYYSTYWEKFKGVWTHGDHVYIDKDGLWYIVGRSDDTIKVAGKRLGPAEVEDICNQIANVKECAAIGVNDETKGEALVVYCVPHFGPDGSPFQSKTVAIETCLTSLRQTITSTLANELGKPLAPKEVRFVQSLPRTRNAKVVHRLIRALYHDPTAQTIGDISSIENHEAIEHLVNHF